MRIELRTKRHLLRLLGDLWDPFEDMPQRAGMEWLKFTDENKHGEKCN